MVFLGYFSLCPFWVSPLHPSKQDRSWSWWNAQEEDEDNNPSSAWSGGWQHRQWRHRQWLQDSSWRSTEQEQGREHAAAATSWKQTKKDKSSSYAWLLSATEKQLQSCQATGGKEGLLNTQKELRKELGVETYRKTKWSYSRYGRGDRGDRQTAPSIEEQEALLASHLQRLGLNPRRYLHERFVFQHYGVSLRQEFSEFNGYMTRCELRNVNGKALRKISPLMEIQGVFYPHVSGGSAVGGVPYLLVEEERDDWCCDCERSHCWRCFCKLHLVPAPHFCSVRISDQALRLLTLLQLQ